MQNFCESCLHHYAIYKINNFEEVCCPHEGCPKTLDMNTKFFKNLPVNVQKNYRKIYQFQLISKDPNVKLCPKENCEGIMKPSAENVMICDSCHQQFCGKCLLPSHEGNCDQEEVNFF